MAWTTPGTAVAGEVLTAAFWNEQVRDNALAIRDAQVNVASTTLTTAFSTTSNTFVDVTGLAVTITPTLATSKVLILMNIHLGLADTLALMRLNLVRGSTDICQGTSGTSDNQTFNFGGMGNFGSGRWHQNWALSFLDAPNVATATTYKVQIRTESSVSLRVNRWELNGNHGSTSTITAIEVPV